MTTPRDEWHRAVTWALAAGLPADKAIKAADRREKDLDEIAAASRERFDEYGMRRDA